MGFEFTDAVKTLLNGEWNSANTDSVSPSVRNTGAFKAVDLRAGNDGDVVLVYSLASVDAPNGFGPTGKKTTSFARVDALTQRGGVHLRKMVVEVKRIIDGYRDCLGGEVTW